MTPKEELIELFTKFWNSCASDFIRSECEEMTPDIFKTNCSYCGLTVEYPYPQHEECIKIQIQVEKEAIKNARV